MIMALIDHKIMEKGRINMENEIEMEWTGSNRQHKVSWSHSMAKNKHIGGITIAVHPIIGRYARVTDNCQDPRDWGRWTAIEIWGRKRKTLIIATYGPVKNEDEEATNSMWYRQSVEMKKIPAKERCKNPKEQYIKDINEYIDQMQTKEKFEIILTGDMNINPDKDNKTAYTWNSEIRNNGLLNTMNTWWPNLKHQFATHKSTWIDHIYVSAKIIQEGSITQAGIETGHTCYKSDHNMIGVEINFTKLTGRIQGQETLYQQKIRTVKAGITENKEQYKRIATERNEKNGNKIPEWAEEIVQITDRWKKENQHIQGTVNDKDKQKFKRKLT
jgi:exonuclease III